MPRIPNPIENLIKVALVEKTVLTRKFHWSLQHRISGLRRSGFWWSFRLWTARRRNLGLILETRRRYLFEAHTSSCYALPASACQDLLSRIPDDNVTNDALQVEGSITAFDDSLRKVMLFRWRRARLIERYELLL
jgi:hypothetical protein